MYNTRFLAETIFDNDTMINIVKKPISAINNTSVAVKLGAPFEGEVAAADFTIEGLTVTNAVLGTSKDTVTLTTEAQTADKEYTVVYKGAADNSAKFVGKKAEGQAFEIASATARLNTEVTVVLTDAPLRNLTVADFQVAGLEVTSVTTNNNVATLKTSPQVGGASYTVTTPVGAGSATFTGLAAVDTAGVISKVNLENNRQIKIEFNRDITWATAKDLSNYFIGMTTETAGKLAETGLDKLASNGNWKIVTEGQVKDETDTKGTVKYVIIESTDGALVTGKADTTDKGLGLVKNETVTFETRGLKDAAGYVSNSKGSFVVVDNVKPSVVSVTKTASINGLWKANAAATTQTDYLGYTIAANKAYLEVVFSEPVENFDDKDFKVYVDGLAINDTTDVKVLAHANTEFIKQDGTIQQGSTMLIDVTALDKAEHDLKIVGANDLVDNVMSPNPFQTKFTVADEVKTPPASAVKPNVTGITQIADNAIEITFDQPNVNKVNGATAASVIVKGADFINNNTTAADVAIADDKIVVENIVDADGKLVGTKWIAQLPSNIDNAGLTSAAGTGSSVDFLNQEQILRTIEVTNYQVGTATIDGYYHGDTYRTEKALSLDVKAPEVQTVTTGIYNGDVLAPQLNVTFSDAPFAGTIQKGTGNIKVSRTDKNGKTTDEIIDITTAGVVNTASTTGTTGTALTANAKGLTIHLADNSELVDDTGKLFAESVYTVEFADDTIKDADEVTTSKNPLVGTALTTGLSLANIKNTTAVTGSDFNKIKKVAKSVSTPKPGQAAAAEGLVPQTSKGLIASGLDTAKVTATTGATVNNATAAATQVGSPAWFALDENKNKIIVVFDGEVLESSALNKGNYKFNGAALPANSKVTFYSADVNNNTEVSAADSKDNFVIIELPEGSVQKEGQYDVEVFNITNKSGKLMLPVQSSVKLADNTKPTATAVKIIGSRQVEVTFDEVVSGLNGAAIDATLAKNNFVVTVNGQGLAVTDVKYGAGSAKNKVVLELSQDFTITGAKATVQIKADVNGKIHLFDAANNEVTVGTKSN